jgi:hypothetical protein
MQLPSAWVQVAGIVSDCFILLCQMPARRRRTFEPVALKSNSHEVRAESTAAGATRPDVQLDVTGKLAGADGNRTHQEPVSRPFSGFEDRAGHQPRNRSRLPPIEAANQQTMRSATLSPALPGRCDVASGDR